MDTAQSDTLSTSQRQDSTSVSSCLSKHQTPATDNNVQTIATQQQTADSRASSASLQIFFPSDNLSLRAILSPTTARNSRHADSFHPDTNMSMKSQRDSSRAKLSAFDHTIDNNRILGSQKYLSDREEMQSPTQGLKTHSTVMIHPDLSPPPFANMTMCDNCRDDIGTLLTKGRHHCRNCGGSFCASCSSKTINVPFPLLLSKGEQRVCDSCYFRIKDFHEQLQCTKVSWNGLDPQSNHTFIDTFHLEAHELPITIYHCCYFMDLSPHYGHAYFTRHHLCFCPYRRAADLILKIPYRDVESLGKPEFYYINALQVKTIAGSKYFFAEFNGLRDHCFLRMDQLIRADQDGMKYHSSERTDLTQLALQANIRRQMYRRKHSTDESPDAQRSNEPAAFIPLLPDEPLSKMTLVLDCELFSDVNIIYDSLWKNGIGQEFYRAFMIKTRDIDIEIGSWETISDAAENTNGFEISKESDYSFVRHIRSQHPPKASFPGLPPYATCHRIQRFRAQSEDNSSSTWNRFIVSEILRTSKIPFSDYFEIEIRWVFTQDGQGFCHVEVGLAIHYLRSTWFKTQINSSTISEMKQVLQIWAQMAVHHLESNPQPIIQESLEKQSVPNEMKTVLEIEERDSLPLLVCSPSSSFLARQWSLLEIVLLVLVLVLAIALFITNYKSDTGAYRTILQKLEQLHALQCRDQEQCLALP